MRVDAAVQRAMAKSPADRFATMADFGRELEACVSGDSEEGTQVIAPPPAVRGHRRVSPWPLVLVLVGVLAVGGALAYLVLRGTSSLPGGGAPAGPPPKLRAITAYDPKGTGTPGENDAKAPLATDGSLATSWATENYHDGELHKPGVGLVLDAGSGRTVRQIDVDTITPGFTAVIKAGDSEQDFPDTVSGVQVVSSSQASFAVGGGAHRYYLLWITDLGGNRQVRITEVKAAS
jgi:hypothetical protein